MKKRFLAMLLAAAMTMSLCSCGKKSGGDNGNGSGGNSTTEEKVDIKQVTFRAADDQLKFDGVEGEIDNAVRFGDNLVFSTYSWTEGEAVASEADAEMIDMGSSTERLYMAPLEGGSAKQIFQTASENSYLSRVIAGNDKLYAMVNEYQNKYDDESKVKLIEFDAEGNQISDKDVSFLNENIGDSYLSTLKISPEGNLVAVYDKEVKIFDESGKELSSAKTDNWIMGCCLTKSGEILIFANDKDGRMVAKVMDEKSGDFKKDYKMGASYLQSPEWIYPGQGDYDFFYRNEQAFFGYNLEAGKETRICDFIASDIDATYINTCILLDENTILAIGYNWENQTPIYDKYVKVDPSEVQDKKEITLLSTWVSSDLKQEVINFNKTHDDVRITLIDYSDDENPGEKISADIAAGKIPDIYDVSNGIGNISTDQAVAKGMLEDLTPYIQNDPEISEDDFIPAVYDAMKIDGKNYYVASSFGIQAMLGKKSDIGDIDGWTFEEMKAYVDSKPEDTRMFESTSKDDNLQTFLYCCGADFVDWEKGECYFNTPEFKSLLEVSNRGDDQEIDWENLKTSQDLRSGKQLFLIGGVNPDELQVYKELFDNDLAVVGYPNKDKQGIYAQIDNGLAMSSKCADKDLAWEFIRTFMTKDYQGHHYTNAFGCPTRKDVLEAFYKSKTTTEEYDDEFGNHIYPTEGSWGWHDLIVEVKPVSNEEIEFFNTTINRISGIWEYDDSLNTIIEEEAKAYFAGEKSVDEVCEIIQNRATTYVQENK